jgi:hypothetical protein
MWTTIKICGKEYKLRLTASRIVALEKSLGGKNPLDVLTVVEGGSMPPVTGVLLILHSAMQKFHHGIKWEDVLQMYDDYVDEGNTYTDLIPVLVEVFKVSGFFQQDQDPEKESNPEDPDLS